MVRNIVLFILVILVASAVLLSIKGSAREAPTVTQWVDTLPVLKIPDSIKEQHLQDMRKMGRVGVDSATIDTIRRFLGIRVDSLPYVKVQGEMCESRVWVSSEILIHEKLRITATQDTIFVDTTKVKVIFWKFVN